MPTQSTRAIQDSLLAVTSNFNVAGATTSTNAIDLGQATAFPVNEQITVQVSTVVATGANNKNVNIALQDSNVNTAANFTNVTVGSLPVVVIIPEVSATYAATNVNIALPPGTRQFIRLKANTEASGGNASDGTYTLKVLF
jgi:hypothetical protein